ncbi:hypothetical protein E2C01_080054 [Portunus trituberculatus]|uniref:Uncharacterized protein n=1 Tax=Portunus trituberculatus TaxID=210409 RepID=A0A5B7IUZ2_PORTR|nr:hypothetical protein [Portunus trituberculatus]
MITETVDRICEIVQMGSRLPQAGSNDGSHCSLMKTCGKGKDYRTTDGTQVDDVESCMEEKGPDGGWGWVVVFACFMLWVSTRECCVLFLMA